jgi:hypothetical protein
LLVVPRKSFEAMVWANEDLGMHANMQLKARLALIVNLSGWCDSNPHVDTSDRLLLRVPTVTDPTFFGVDLP